MPERVAAVILAAGAGARMRSALPKPLHLLCGRPMIDYVLDAADIPSLEQTIVVLSPALDADDGLQAHLRRRLGERLSVVVQPEPLGTGDALSRAVPLISDASTAVVLFADHPLLTRERMAALSMPQGREGPAVRLLTCAVEDAAGYGRVERNAKGRILRIVELRDDAADLRGGPTEINSGMMAVDVAWLRSAVKQLTPSDATGEVYLTQLVELAVRDGREVASVQGDESELLGVNDRADLARAESHIQAAIQREHFQAGVSFIAPETSVVEYGVAIGADSVILPGCFIRSGSDVGAGCEIGPHSVLVNARIGDGCRILSSYITDSEIRSGSEVGPFSHVRGGSLIESDVHVGNFAEIKSSKLASGVRMGHFGYVGDASIGERTNIGAGAVTCNFDGVDKHRTDVGADAFIGSDTMLVAPVRVGDRAATGAGSVVLQDVPADARVVGVPARQLGPATSKDGK